MWQVFRQLKSVLGEAEVSLHLVEVSPKLSQVQAEHLIRDQQQEYDAEEELVYRSGITQMGLPVYWYRRIEDVPKGTHTTH